MEAIGGWFGSAVVVKLIEISFSYVKDQFLRQTGMTDELRRLQDVQPRVQAIVVASSKLQLRDQNTALDAWLWQLRDAIDEADDVLDELEYFRLEKQLKDGQTKVQSTASSLKRRFVKFGKRAFKDDSTLKRLRGAVKRLDEVFSGVGEFYQLVESTKHQLPAFDIHSRESSSLERITMLGREKEKEWIIQWLTKQPGDDELHHHGAVYKNISVLSIVGIGGIGKTTLLQNVYKDESVKEFDLKLWVCVSNVFDVKNLIRDMLEFLTGDRPNLGTLNAIQENLRTMLVSKKFLLVLDDVWEEHDQGKWEDLLAPLIYGKEGSKLLISTRMESVAVVIASVIKKRKESLKLEGLGKEDLLRLLNSFAFAGVVNYDKHSKLEFIGGKIADKLRGSPLLAKVIGGALNSNLAERHWLNILNSDIQSAHQGHPSIMSVLRLSYNHLPVYLQTCFAFCSILPLRSKFNKDDLVLMWMAVGFIHQPLSEGETVEDIAEKYFDALVKKSFFEEVESKFYIMHDLLHELAQLVFAHECSRVMDVKVIGKLPSTIRHLSVEIDQMDVLLELRKFKNLRTLLLKFDGDDLNIVLTFSEVLKALKSIRLLHIDVKHMKVLPNEIGDLMHLRYFNLHNANIIRLPQSLSKLYHLEIIIAYRNRRFVDLAPNFFPKNLSNLIKLRHLILPYSWGGIDPINDLGKLTHLQELQGFYIGKSASYKFSELNTMTELREIRMIGLENVKDFDDARNVKLIDKNQLHTLHLQWAWFQCENRSRNVVFPSIEEQLLDLLQPHSNLKKLRILDYVGARSATWMESHLISNLEYIELENCSMWQQLPPLGCLPFLKSLHLRNMPSVVKLGYKLYGGRQSCVFPSLEQLFIEKLQSVEEWFDTVEDEGRHFPCLRQLKLLECPKLRQLPSIPHSLQDLEIVDVGLTTFPEPRPTNSCGSSSSSLEILRIERLEELEDCIISAKEFGQLFPCLRELYVWECPWLRNISSLPFSLNKLHAYNLGLRVFPVHNKCCSLSVSSSLVEIDFSDCSNIKTLPASEVLEEFTALEKLSITNCEELTSLGGLRAIHTLKRLVILCCPKLIQKISEPSSEEGGRPDEYPFLLEELEIDDPSLLLCFPFRTLTSLKTLEIEGNDELVLFPVDVELWFVQNCSSLYELRLGVLRSLQSLPSCLQSLSSLTVLQLNIIPMIQTLPNLPASLQQLTIRFCHPMLKERCSSDRGLDWPKVSHIPHFHISTKWN